MNIKDFDYDKLLEENLKLARIKLQEDAAKQLFLGITTWNRVPLHLFSQEELVILLTLLTEKIRKSEN